MVGKLEKAHNMKAQGAEEADNSNEMSYPPKTSNCQGRVAALMGAFQENTRMVRKVSVSYIEACTLFEESHPKWICRSNYDPIGHII